MRPNILFLRTLKESSCLSLVEASYLKIYFVFLLSFKCLFLVEGLLRLVTLRLFFGGIYVLVGNWYGYCYVGGLGLPFFGFWRCLGLF